MPLRTVGGSCVYCAPTLSSEDVDLIGDRFHVCRVHARSVSAEMVNREPRWNRPNEALISEPMSIDVFIP